MRQPAFHPDKVASAVNVADDTEWNNIQKHLDQSGLGKISNIQEG